MIDAKIILKIRPFLVPNFVHFELKAGDEGLSLPLSVVDPETLERLCRDFRAEVFTKAGHASTGAHSSQAQGELSVKEQK